MKSRQQSKQNQAISKPLFNEAQKKAFFDDFMSGFNQLKEASQSSSLNKNISRPILTSVGSSPQKENKQASISSSVLTKVRNAAQSACTREKSHLNTEELRIWQVILSANRAASHIVSCDLPWDIEDNAVMVKVVQDYADTRLGDEIVSWLRKIIEIAIYSKEYGYGNCQEKTFYAFSVLLHQLFKNEVAIQSLRLASFDNHFILIVNERFVVDSWLNFAFPAAIGKLDESLNNVFDGFGELVNYFWINNNKHCVTYGVTVGASVEFDDASTADVDHCVGLIDAHLQESYAGSRKRKHVELHEESNPNKSLRTDHVSSSSYSL